MRTTENRPLLSESTNSLTSIPISVKEEKTALSPKHSVIGVIGLLCIFLFIILTALFAGLYVKLLKGKPEKYPPFPPPSGTLLGEYAKAAVAADHEMCSEIGRDIMLKGGNAVDAAIATLFCIGVMDTQSAGIGGGHFMTIFNATTKKCHVVDAREMAPAAAFEEMYKNKWDQSKFGWKAVAVTGDVHGLWTEYKNFGGRVSWKTILQPTIDIMKEGYPTSHALAFALKAFEKGIRKEPSMHRFINPKTNQTYKVGEQIKTRRNLLKTFKLLANASDPVQFLYNSSFTDKIVAEFQANGGIITKEDFVNYKSIIRDDNDVVYTYLKNGRQICGPPPPSGSAVTQAILNILDGYDDYENVTTFEDYVNLFHRYIEASKFAYAQRSGLGDMNFIKNATDIARNITSSKWAEDVRSKITHETHEDDYYGGNFQALPPDHGTTHIAVIDKWGNAVSVTSTINLVLGSMVMSESSGILWNDQMDDFSSPGHPNYYGYPPTPSNYIRPGKRPMSSTSPIIVYDNKTGETTALGGAGGSTIISGVSFVAMKALWMKKDVKYAIDFPRLHNQLKPNVTTYEKRWPKQYIDALAERGHEMEPSSSNITVGNVITSVQKKPTGIVYANSDFRKGSESEPAGF